MIVNCSFIWFLSGLYFVLMLWHFGYLFWISNFSYQSSVCTPSIWREGRLKVWRRLWRGDGKCRLLQSGIGKTGRQNTRGGRCGMAGKESLLKRVWFYFSLKWLSRVTVNKGWSGFVVDSYVLFQNGLQTWQAWAEGWRCHLPCKIQVQCFQYQSFSKVQMLFNLFHIFQFKIHF